MSNSRKIALICGISGQDGAYLARFLLGKGYEVHGTSRDSQATAFSGLQRLGILNQVQLHSMALTDFRSVVQTITLVKPNEIYNLSGQSSVGLSFDQPVETMESISAATLNLLECIRFSGIPIRFYNAGSSESFGDTGDVPASESTPFRPRSPYAVAKATAYWEVASYREAYRIFACTGILFNHESPLRPERFVTRKIVSAAVRIAGGSKERLRLGNTSILRDWGWAPEYIEAMWMMLQQPKADDFVIATGESHRLEDFLDEAFRAVGLTWRDHVETDPGLYRPSDLGVGRADPSKAKRVLGWSARVAMRDVVQRMIESEKSGLL